MNRRIYLDYAAATSLDPAAEEAMRPYYSSVFGNPSAIHMFGQEASAAVFHARKAIGEALGAHYREIVFTGSATEANNLAVYGTVMQAPRKQNSSVPATELSSRSVRLRVLARPSQSDLRDVPQNPYDRPKILVLGIEHESIRAVCADLKDLGVEIVDIPVDNVGIIDLEFLKKSLDDRVVLVSVQYTNSEIGVVQPIREIGQIIADYKLNAKSSTYPLLHTDAVQAFQYFKCDVEELGVDMLTLSAHKIYGPKGIGALYVRNPKSEIRNPNGGKNTSSFDFRASNFLKPSVLGGGQEYGMRSGTENVPAIVGFAKAVEIAEGMREKESERVAALRDLLWEGIRAIVPDAEMNGSLDHRVPNNLNVYFSGHSAQDMCIELDMQGIAVSPGTACSSRASQPSYVIAALGFSGDRPSSSLRFSLGRQTTKDEIEAVLAIFKKRFGV